MNTWKFNLTLIGLFLATFAFAQPDKTLPEGEYGVDYNVTDSQGKKQGNWVRVYKNGRIYYKGQFENDVPSGEFWFWYDTGETMSKVVHLDGKKHMDVVNYYKNGQPMSAGHYKESKAIDEVDKLRDGEWTFYSEEGAVKTVENYTMGLRNGKSVSFYQNGKVLLEYNFENDLREGPWVEYFDNGRVKSKGKSTKDEYNGPFELFHYSGTSKMRGFYANGKKDGVWIFFNKDGSIQITTKFDNGVEIATKRENGEFTDYYESGIPKAYYQYEDGELSGPFQEFYDQGQWTQEPLDQAQPGGGIQFKEKLIGTQILREGDYLNGKLDGPVTYYDERGRVIREENYVDGELESSEER